MPSFDSFLHPRRRPHAKFRLAGFADEFEMKVVTREEERLIAEQYPDAGQSDKLDLLIAYALVNPPLLKKDFLDALSKREGRPVLDALDAIHTVFTANECNMLFAKYQELADLTVKVDKKIEDLKNASGEGA